MRVAVVAVILGLAVAVQAQTWENVLVYSSSSCSGNAEAIVSSPLTSCNAASCFTYNGINAMVTCTSSAYIPNGQYLVQETYSGSSCTGNLAIVASLLADGGCYGLSSGGTTTYFQNTCGSPIIAKLCTDSACSNCMTQTYTPNQCNNFTSTMYCTASSQPQTWENVLLYVSSSCSGAAVIFESVPTTSCSDVSCIPTAGLNAHSTCTSSPYIPSGEYFVEETYSGSSCTGSVASVQGALADGSCYGVSTNGNSVYLQFTCGSTITKKLCTDSACSNCTTETFIPNQCGNNNVKGYCTASSQPSSSSQLSALFAMSLLAMVAAIFVKA